MTNTKKARAAATRALLGLSVAALLLAAAAAVAPAAPAASGQAARAAAKETFASFWTRFKAALVKDDRAAVAAMTKFRTGDETYLSDKEFLAKWYGELRRERRCFARAKPVADQESYSVFCGERIFVFGRIGGAWKFVDIGAND
jgi:outer membrane biogenesis lipoprotein LolB